MAKKVDDELADPYERIISEPIDYVILQKTAGATEWTYSGGDAQWLPVNGNPLAMSWESSIDLSGYANQHLTFFPETGFIQQSPVIALDNGAAMHIMTVISSVPQDIPTLYSLLIAGSTPSVATENWETILYCRIETFTSNTNTPSSFNYLSPQGASQTGSLSPTAADKLYVYRIVMPVEVVALTTDYTRMQIPACRVGLIGQMAEEPTIEYMMRLKRSYELANQV